MATKMNRQIPKFWNVITDKGTGKGEITLEGEIVDTPPTDMCGMVAAGNYYTSEEFRNDIAACEGLEEVTVNINSVGGDLFQGIAIHNALRALPCKVKTVVQGVAASAASIIFCAGDERLVYPGSILMVHGVMSYVDFYGYVNEHGITELQAQLKNLRKSTAVMNSAVADIYAETTGKTHEECLSLIADNAELYMSGADAIAQGFASGYAADGYVPEVRMVACAGKTALYSNHKLLSEDFKAPSLNADALGIKQTAEAPTAEVEKEKENNMSEENTHIEKEVTEKDKPGDTTQTTPEVTETAPQPEVPAGDVKAAIAADRKRIASIDAIAKRWGNVINAELVEVAKYGNETEEPMTAEAFAYAVMSSVDPTKLAAGNSNFIAARASETQDNNKVAASATAFEHPTNTERNANGVRKDIQDLINTLN